ncbi:carboxymuconolactone decarboxylase family protein [Mangrovicoccus sp. HB161399]|uniref:carboxymuconolactone decarboxylase family protein n=1 Tax=Mangrovicoccus sp. HB161399 TaxID=2720392 RepID=UPI001556B6E9|nr:carboxymuconolactone decarboxylase family protein [Mangrovicoccus sp. HB161399]
MSRIAVPASAEAAPDAPRPLPEQVKAQLGSMPNLFRLAAASFAALEGPPGLFGAPGKGRLPAAAAARERIALAIAEFNGCGLPAHACLAADFAKQPPEDIAANRRGRSSGPKADAALALALKVAGARGRVSDADLAAVRAAGHGEAEATEFVRNVALNIWTNYVNEVAQTPIDFPLAEGAAA